MSLKDIFLIFLLILIFGTVIFGSLGNFFSLVNIVVSDVSDAVDNEKTFTVDFLEKNSPSHLNKEHSNNNVSNNQYSGDGSSQLSNFPFMGSKNPEGDSSPKKYEDYQINKETGMFDSEGNPIYLSIVSTSGGQMDPGIYEVYWSKLMVFNHTKIK